MIKNWTYQEEYKKLRKKIISSIDRTLLSGNIFFGDQLNKFEKKFIKKYKLRYGAAVGSGTDALIIALKSAGIKPGDEVITVSNTAIPTVAAIKNIGAIPVFVDVNEFYLMNTNLIKKKITRKTKAIIPVHLYGQACNIDKIIKISNKYKIIIIEDCAQAQGAKYKNRYVGTFGHLSCFSFYPTKILGTYGDGGFIACKNKKLLSEIKRQRFYGIETTNKKNKFYKKYYSIGEGINSRLNEINATILNLKFNYTDKNILIRNRIAKFYLKELNNCELKLPLLNKHNKHVYHLFVVYHKKRDQILKYLKNKITFNINYPYPIHEMKAHKSFVCKNCHCLNNTKKYSKGIFSLPLFPEIKNNELKYIVKNLKIALKKFK